MSSVLAPGSTIDADNLDFNTRGGFDIVGDQDGPNVVFLAEDGSENLGDDFIIGGFADDTLSTGAGDDILATGAGEDFIIGGDGTDVIRGGEGDDVIIGGAGADIMSGGGGSDLFILSGEDFAAGEKDVIQDFTVGHDELLINGVSEDASVSYHAATGNVTVGDQVVARLDPNLDVTVDQLDDDTWQLF